MTLAPGASAAAVGAAGRGPLAILCGGGDFPVAVARAAAAQGRDPFLVGVVGAADARIEAFAHLWVHVGEVGRLFAALKARGVTQIAIVGAMTRPEFADLRLDWGALRRLAGLAALFRGGDNQLLVGISKFFEAEGVAVVGVHEVAPGLVAAPGLLGARRPSAQAASDARRGGALLDALSPFDAGQAVVVANGRVLAIEAAEGTDAMLARVAELRARRRLRLRGRVGVLVKAPKRGQDLRLDMPAVGPGTIAAARAAELEGVALAAGRVLIADRDGFGRAADAAGLFVLGLEA